MVLLSPQALYKRCESSIFKFKTTAELPDYYESAIGQERALKSIEFGIDVDSKGFNLFVLGERGTGKTSTIRNIIKEKCKDIPIPDDWCYVYNFKYPDVPMAMSFAPGKALIFQQDMEELLKTLRVEIPKVFDSREYVRQKNNILADLQKIQKEQLEALDNEAKVKGFTIKRASGGFFLSPIKKNGEPLTEVEFAELHETEKLRLEQIGRGLQEKLNDVMRVLRENEKDSKNKLKKFDRETALSVIAPLINDILEKHNKEEVNNYLEEAREDMLNNLDEFRVNDEQDEQRQQAMFFPTERLPKGTYFNKYYVNIIVNNGDLGCAPWVFETNPNYYNLFGRIEHKVHYGMAVTDFTMIKPGSLHKANGGYLVIDVLDLLKNIFAYDTLKKAIKNDEIKIEDVWEQYRLATSTTLRPEPIPLKVKVILIGTPELYYALYNLDDEYKELFKVKADFASKIDRSEENVLKYASFIATKCKETGLLPFDTSAVAKIVEYGSRVAEHQDKLTTMLGFISDVLRESDHWAKKDNKTVIDSESVERALTEKLYRHRKIEELMQEMTKEGTVIVDTSGEVIGQINGLAVLDMGDHSFGKPSRITSRTYMGKAGVVNIEREIKMSGKIHEKAVLTISHYLGSKYAIKNSITLSASITFEQLYGIIEGDSATCAEFYALISSIANVPIRQCMAVTGSMDQNGRVQPVGGLNEKIEGFFDLCAYRGLNGSHGVIIPRLNEKHIMLKREVTEAVEKGLFFVYSIDFIDEGFELLTGLKAGDQLEDGTYPEGTINYLVEKRLTEIRTAMKKEGEKNSNGKGADNKLNNNEGETK
ncbi:MAG: AAA family ATPase [Candidatus Magnetoovum sp. WYHC-5]|nr:AAA family ATPase [Candidatus Magnetoovum sp. WYHC-5]